MSWVGLSKAKSRLDALGARLYGLSANTPEEQAGFRARLGIPYTLLSDPGLRAAEAFDIPVSRHHPMSRRYRLGAFVQPALFVWRQDGSLAYAWRTTPKLTNLYGAAGRPSPDDTLAIVERALDH